MSTILRFQPMKRYPVLLILFVFIWIRATLPRIRYDRLMSFGWKVTFPLSLLSVLVTAAAILLVGG